MVVVSSARHQVGRPERKFQPDWSSIFINADLDSAQSYSKVRTQPYQTLNNNSMHIAGRSGRFSFLQQAPSDTLSPHLIESRNAIHHISFDIALASHS